MKDLKAVFNPAPVDDWSAFQAEELAIDKALEYVLGGRI